MKALLLSCLIAFCVPSQANERIDNGPLTVYEQLRKHVKFSTYSQRNQLEGKVYVRFFVDEYHVVRVRVVSGSNKQLTRYVRQRLHNKEVFGQSIQKYKDFEMTFSYFSPYRIGDRTGSRPLR